MTCFVLFGMSFLLLRKEEWSPWAVVSARFGPGEALRRLERGTLLKRRALDDAAEWEFLVVNKFKEVSEEELLRFGASRSGKNPDLKGIHSASSFREVLDNEAPEYE